MYDYAYSTTIAGAILLPDSAGSASERSGGGDRSRCLLIAFPRDPAARGVVMLPPEPGKVLWVK